MNFLKVTCPPLQTTKPILLDSLYKAAVVCSESSNIGLVVLIKIYLQTTKRILLDSLHITAAKYSESSNIGLVV
jgi:hypothetical protein